MGGAAIDLASVSCGRVDAYFERGLNPWDYAAGAVLVTEAGGLITDLEGRPTTGDMTVAAPEAIHGPLLELLRSAGADRV
jgi:fructose-1,6-bisphosphatase/inositol monophosphatase family enzyme